MPISQEVGIKDLQEFFKLIHDSLQGKWRMAEQMAQRSKPSA
jgi:hypothetical protein